jgi:hypothetical protein
VRAYLCRVFPGPQSIADGMVRFFLPLADHFNHPVVRLT